ncbi:MAG TPA: hypothetical protein EYG89_04150 [Bacteroidia bacterium]|nr:hypothetical protein [Bacteroidia bacterium]
MLHTQTIGSNLKKPQMTTEQTIIDKCKQFSVKADYLETKAFNDLSYRENDFKNDFNKLFQQYCFGKQNRTISGLNFGKPARYSTINTANKTEVKQLSKTRYQVTFETEPKFQSIRFILDKRQNDWKLIRFETYVGISRHSKNAGEELWRKHKL